MLIYFCGKVPFNNFFLLFTYKSQTILTICTKRHSDAFFSLVKLIRMQRTAGGTKRICHKGPFSMNDKPSADRNEHANNFATYTVCGKVYALKYCHCCINFFTLKMAYANAATCLCLNSKVLCIFLKYLSNCCYSDVLVM